MLVTVGFTTAVWLIVTMLTAAEPISKLVEFYKQVQPEGPGWNRVSERADLKQASISGGLAIQFLNWFLGCVLIYAFLFGIGYVILGEVLKGSAYLVGGVLAFAAIMRNLKRAGWQTTSDESATVRDVVTEA
jgi:hypothetical protein